MEVHMNRPIKTLTLIILLTIVVIPITVQAVNKHYTIFIDSEPIYFRDDVGYPKETNNGRTLIPIRIVSEDMGYKLEWASNERKVTILDDKTKIDFKVGENTALVNGKTVTVDAKAQIIGGRTYVPLRFVSEAMNATIDYRTNPYAHYIYITKPGSESIAPDIDQKTPDVGKIPGVAEYSEKGHAENIKKVSNFFGTALDKEMSGSGMSSFNPTGGGTDGSFLYIVDRQGEEYEAKVVVKSWFTNDVIGTPYEKEYRTIGPTTKEVLRFYLPNGYEKLYKIIDDGYNFRWDDASKYVGKDLSKMIGSHKKVVLIDGNGGLQIEIGDSPSAQ